MAACVYIFIAKSHHKGPLAKSASPLDITPLIVSKLQKMVKESSDGLYNLSIEQLKPHITSAEVDIIKVTLIPDSVALLKLDSEHKAPDDVFSLSFDSIHITGLTLTDFLNKKDISLDTVFISSPAIQVTHRERSYNASARAKDSALTLYQKLSGQFTSISIGAVIAQGGTFTSTNLLPKKIITRFGGVNIETSHLKIDSLTQFDKNRFLFSKTASFSCGDFAARTADSLYIFKVGSFSVIADKHLMIAKEVMLEPRGNKEEFQKKLTTKQEMFTVRFPEITCINIDWWALVNRTRLIADEITIRDGSVKDYLNPYLPSDTTSGKKNNFPQQLLMEVPLSVNIQKLTTQRFTVSYEEYSPQSKQSGMITFNNIAATITHITNVAAQIKTHAVSNCSATALFMNQVPLTANISFDLSKLKTGTFSAQFHLGAVANTILNPVTEPLAMFTLKSGHIDEASINISGDNSKATTGITLLYHHLKIFPLKDPGKNGDLKKKAITGFLANAFIIKDANPAGNKSPRSPEVMVQRGTSGSFFNFLWKAILSGLVKSIGLPKKFANQ